MSYIAPKPPVPEASLSAQDTNTPLCGAGPYNVACGGVPVHPYAQTNRPGGATDDLSQDDDTL